MNAQQADPPQTSSPSHPVRIALLVAAAFAILTAAGLWHLHIADQQLPFDYSDLLPRWAGTRLALHGIDPYAVQPLTQAQAAFHVRSQPFLYPATVIVLLLPLAPLSLQAARLVFLLVVSPLFAWSLWLTMESLGLPAARSRRAVVLAFAFVWWPVLWALRLQQLTLVAAFAIFFAWFLLARGRQVAPGILLAIATFKPQLVVPLLLWLLVWAVLRRQWTLILSFAASLTAILLATARLVPGWLPRWLASLKDYSTVRQTAPPLEFLFGHGAGLIVTVAIVATAAVAMIFLWRCEPSSPRFAMALALLLATTLCLVATAATMIYNNLLLFPACLILIFRRPRDRFASQIGFLALLQLGWDFLAVPVAAACEIAFRPSSFWNALPYVDFLLPALVTVALSLEVLRQPR